MGQRAASEQCECDKRWAETPGNTFLEVLDRTLIHMLQVNKGGAGGHVLVSVPLKKQRNAHIW